MSRAHLRRPDGRAALASDDEALVRTAPAQLQLSRHAARAALRPHRGAGADGRGGRFQPRHGDGSPVPDPGRRRGRSADARGLVGAQRTGARDEPRSPGHAGQRRHLSQPGAAGQDGDDARHQSPAGGRCSGWELRGTSRSTSATATSSRRSRSAWIDSRTRWPSRARCSASRAPLSPAAIRASSDALNYPRPIQPGGPRIMVGGGGEQRTLRIAARYADLTHWFPLGMETLQRKTDLLARLLRRDRPRPGRDRADDGGAGHRR